MAMIKCPECGQEISDKAKKCVHCGKVLIEDKPATKVCSDCGKENPIDATECVHCGCPFEEEKKDRKWKNGISVAGIVVPIVVTVWGTLKTLKFEETGTVTTNAGRSFMNRLFKK